MQGDPGSIGTHAPGRHRPAGRPPGNYGHRECIACGQLASDRDGHPDVAGRRPAIGHVRLAQGGSERLGTSICLRSSRVDGPVIRDSPSSGVRVDIRARAVAVGMRLVALET
jgi:hypothetical protein